MTIDYNHARELMVEQQIRPWEVLDPTVLELLSVVKRERFVPAAHKDLAFAVHGELICKNGIFNHENLDFTGLIADRKYQFAYIVSPAPIKGATGSNGGPIAVT